jgi:hypothetical protein
LQTVPFPKLNPFDDFGLLVEPRAVGTTWDADGRNVEVIVRQRVIDSSVA